MKKSSWIAQTALLACIISGLLPSYAMEKNKEAEALAYTHTLEKRLLKRQQKSDQHKAHPLY